MGLKGGEWDISIFGLGVESIGKSWLESMTSVHITSVLDLITLGVSDFFLRLILGLNVFASCHDWNLSSSNLRLGLSFDGVFDFIVEDLNIPEPFFFTISSVGVFRSFLVVLD